MSGAKHTPGPWRWELNEETKGLALVGGRPQFDLHIIEPVRWGMGRATLMIRDTDHDGMNLMYRLHERRDWIRPHAGRAHHARWCANVIHPDMRLIAAAPDLLEALEEIVRFNVPLPNGLLDQAMAAIAKSTRIEGEENL